MEEENGCIGCEEAALLNKYWNENEQHRREVYYPWLRAQPIPDKVVETFSLGTRLSGNVRTYTNKGGQYEFK